MMNQIITAVVLTASLAALLIKIFHKKEEKAQSYYNNTWANKERQDTTIRDNYESPNTCIICDETNSGKEIIVLPVCGHIFHLDCFKCYKIVRNMEKEDPNVCPIANCRGSTRA